VAVSAAALLGGSVANAADNTVMAKAATDVTQQSDALRNAERYSGIINDGVRLRFRQDVRTAGIIVEYVNVERRSDRHQIEFWLVTLMRICRQVTDSRVTPRHLRRDAPPAEFRIFFGTDVEFGADADEIVFSARVTSLPVGA
jgi:hypothetical protein